MPYKKNKQLVTILLASTLPLLAGAANINLVGNDSVGTSSFNSGQNWAGGAAPSAGNDYYSAGFFLRSPGNGTTAYTFGGNSLSLGPVNLSGGVNGSMLEKFSSGAGSVRTLTINNLTNQANAMIRSGGTAGALIHIAGNHYTIAGNSIIQADQCIWVIDSPLLGADSIILTNNANNANDHVAFTANNSGFTGSLYLEAGGTTAFSLELDAVNSVPANPSTFNPGQVTFLGGGQLHDIIGCIFTNSNGGFTLAANGNINTTAITLIGEPITDVTNETSFPNNHAFTSLTSSGAGTLILSNANNNYFGGTTISAGILQLGVANAIPAPANATFGDVTVNGTLDLNTYNLTINGLNGSGIVDTAAGGNPVLTIGANGDSGTFSGTIQNSSGTLTLVKTGAGTETLTGAYTYSGATILAGGTLNFSGPTGVPSTPGSLIISNGTALTANVSSGTALAAGNVVEGTNSSVTLTLSSTATGMNATGLTFQDNAANTFIYGSIAGNPTAPAINVNGGLSAPGSNVVLVISASGLKTGTYTLIKYTGTALPGIANFTLVPPPGVVATLVNNTGNDSLDIDITQVPNQLAWNGVNGTSWDLVTANWTNLVAGGITVFQQYTNGSVVAGDGVTFDDTLTNDMVNPQPTNIVLNSVFYAFPVTFNNTLPYSIAGSGGITGSTTMLVKSNTGSLMLLTSNSFGAGVNIAGGSLIITNDSALGVPTGPVILNGVTLQYNGSTTNNVRTFNMPTASTIDVSASSVVRLGGVISGGGASLNKSDNGMLILAAAETITGNFFAHGGVTILDSGGSINNGGNYSDIGQNGTDNATLTVQGTGAFTNTGDFNLGDLDSSAGTLNMFGNAVVSIQNFFIGSANAASSSASGTVNMNSSTCTLIEKNTAAGNFVVGGRNSASSAGVGVINLTNGYISAACGVRVGDFGTGTINQYGGTLEVTNGGTGINLHRETTATSFGTYNLNGGTLRTEKVTTSSAGTNSLFYFNGGTLQAGSGNLGATPFMNNLVHAYVRNGGAIIDDHGYTISISQALEHSTVAGDNATDGGLTKKGSGTLTMTGTNTFTGPINNTAGTLVLNGPSTYPSTLTVSGGGVQITTASTIQGAITVANGTLLTISQVGSATETFASVTLNGSTNMPGATLGFAPTVANNPAVPLLNCGTLTLNGTNTISLPVENIGTYALIQYTGSIAGSGNCTNLALPQGASGYISNNAANATLYVVITNTGPGIVWTGTNSASGKTNLWDINSTINWVLGSKPTTYHQVVIPGDQVTFNDIGSGTVILNSSVAPTSLLISNNAKNYTFNGSGIISGPTGILKLGTGTAVLSLTNSTYAGNTVISNGTLQVGDTASVSPTANVVIGPAGTLELAGNNQTFGELTGSGIVDEDVGLAVLLTVGTSSGGTWNGSIQDQGHNGIAIIKNGSGTWIVGGNNKLDNGAPFTTTNEFNGGTTIITNGGSFLVSILPTCIGYGTTAAMIMGGGTLAVSNDILAVGYGAGAVGTLTVNSGTVVHAGGTTGSFGGANELIVGDVGATGTLIVNGGQILNSQALWLGQGTGASGTLQLNGGLVQAAQVTANATPTTSIANFNGGTLQANTNSGDFIDISTIANIQSGGLILDDGGFAINLPNGIQGDPVLTGGGLIKQGAGAVYLDSGNTYTGTTVVTNGMLAGAGSITGPVAVAPAGNIGAGDAGGTGTFSLLNNLTLQGNATMRINVTGGTPAQDQISVSGNVSYGGILTVTNITSDTTVLTNGNKFQLFTVTGESSGNFSGIAGSPGAGLGYSFNPTNGILSVVTQTIAPNPTNITVQVSGHTLSLSWPADHQGWILQAQTNSAGAGLLPLGTWFDISGSASGTNETITLDPTQPTVFYRLRRPF